MKIYFEDGVTEEPNYIFDPCWVIEPDGRMWIREISLIRNPNKTTKVEEEPNDCGRKDY